MDQWEYKKKGTQETLGGLSKKVASSSFPMAKFTRLCNYAGTYAREARIVNLLINVKVSLSAEKLMNFII